MPDTSSVTSQISYFKSSLDTQLLDMLWHKYWVNTLASSPLITTRDLATGQITDICEPLFCRRCPWMQASIPLQSWARNAELKSAEVTFCDACDTAAMRFASA